MEKKLRNKSHSFVQLKKQHIVIEWKWLRIGQGPTTSNTRFFCMKCWLISATKIRWHFGRLCGKPWLPRISRLKFAFVFNKVKRKKRVQDQFCVCVKNKQRHSWTLCYAQSQTKTESERFVMRFGQSRWYSWSMLGVCTTFHTEKSDLLFIRFWQKTLPL